MPTKVSSYLTKLGFRQLDVTGDLISYGRENAGEYVVVKESNRIFRYAVDPEAIVDNENIYETADGGNSRWITLGGAALTQTRITYTLETDSNTIPLGIKVLSKSAILLVNVGNTLVLSDEYNLDEEGDNLILSQTFKAGTQVEIICTTGSAGTPVGGGSYGELTGKPSINGNILSGSMSSDDLGLQAKGDYATNTDVTNAVDAAKTELGTTYATKAELNGKASTSDLESYLQKAELTTEVEKLGYAKEEEVAQTYATKAELTSAQSTLNEAIEGVKTEVDTLDKGVAKLAGNNTFTGTNAFTTPAASDNTTKPATTAWVNAKFQVVSALPESPDPDTFYFIPEE